MDRNLLVNMEFGSVVYGTNLPTSDRDFKGIFLPTSREIILNEAPNTITTTTKKDLTAKNTVLDIDSELYSLSYFMKLLLEGQTVCVDMLFTPVEYHTLLGHPVWTEIVNNKNLLLSKQITSFVGYCKTQANKYGIKGSRVNALKAVVDLVEAHLPKKSTHNCGNCDTSSRDGGLYKIVDKLEKLAEANEFIKLVELQNGNSTLAALEVCGKKFALNLSLEYVLSILDKIYSDYGHRAKLAARNEGIDWKALMHAVRIADQAQELLLTGNIEFPRHNAALLKQIRQGELSYQAVAEKIENGLTLIEEAQTKSSLRESPDKEYAESIIHKTYKNVVLAL